MTAITSFRRPVRVILGDRDPSVQRYSDQAIDDAVKTVMQLAKPSLAGFALTPDESGITPDLIAAAGTTVDPSKFALVIWHAVKLFVTPESAAYSYRTRAISESFGENKGRVSDVLMEIHNLENGATVDSRQNYYAWISGMAGLPIWEVMTDVHIRAPFQSATVSRGGIVFGTT